MCTFVLYVCVFQEFKDEMCIHVLCVHVYLGNSRIMCIRVMCIEGWNVYFVCESQKFMDEMCMCVCVSVCVFVVCVCIRNSRLVQSNRPTVVISRIYKLQKKCFYLFMYIKIIWHSSKHKCNIKTLKNSWKLSELCKCYVPKNNIKYI